LSGTAHDATESITVRVPWWWLCVVVALLLHATAGLMAAQLKNPKPKPTPVEMTVRSAPPPPSTPSTPPPPPSPRVARNQRPGGAPQASPVQPVLPPSASPPAERVQLPEAPVGDSMVVPSTKSGWQDRLMSSLQESTPAPTDSGLMPSTATLARVANNDARLHDDENERRLQEDHGPFFRRGIEALRRVWHPDQALAIGDPVSRCGQKTRTTKAVAVINRSGSIVDIDVLAESGCAPLDREAVAAFKRVASFPHPPEGLFVKPDGTPSDTARYPVRFIVTFDGRLNLEWN
jgi:TonB family protein